MRFRLRYTDADFKALQLVKTVELPEIAKEHEELWQCWLDLNGSRGRGFDREPVHITAVESWCRLHRVAPWRRPIFWRVVRTLDAMLTDHLAAANKE